MELAQPSTSHPVLPLPHLPVSPPTLYYLLALLPRGSPPIKLGGLGSNVSSFSVFSPIHYSTFWAKKNAFTHMQNNFTCLSMIPFNAGLNLKLLCIHHGPTPRIIIWSVPMSLSQRRVSLPEQTDKLHWTFKSDDCRKNLLGVRTFSCRRKATTTLTCAHVHHFHRHGRMSFFHRLPVQSLPNKHCTNESNKSCYYYYYCFQFFLTGQFS